MKIIGVRKAFAFYVRQLQHQYRRDNGRCFSRLKCAEIRQALEKVAESTNSSPESVLNWAKGRYFPKGEPLLRLMCHLERRGFVIAELCDLDSNVREILEEISLGNIKLEWAAKRLGFKRRSDFLAVLSGKEKLGSARAKRFGDFVQRLGIVMHIIEMNNIRMLERYLDGGVVSDDFDPPAGVASRQDLAKEKAETFRNRLRQQHRPPRKHRSRNKKS